ncbi:MAG: LysM peptidoglycan-binding domain-containing protein [Dorea sp.]|nr:LysM peptidoglycan-binding domain-containing protein [Dorea sp.]
MEGQFPKNVKQVGNVSDSPKIYVEDYVDTYLNQLKEQGRESLAGVFLIGKNTMTENQECIYVTGAVQMKDLNPENGELDIGPEHLEMAKAESREYFHGEEIIGWLLIMPGHPVGLSGSMIRVHEKLFPEKNSLFILIDSEDEEQVFAYKFHELMQMGGHYIFYEKNPDMQSYMISERKQIGVTPSEVVEDRAAKDFRSTVRGRMEAREQRRESRYVYLTSVLLVIVVLAIGISTMNNYDKMNSVQTSIETLSSAMHQSSLEGDGQAEEGAEMQTAEDGSQENADLQTLQAEDTGQQMEPAVSTVQEDLGDEGDYYVVQKGDTLDIISEKIYGTISKTDAIRQKNGLEDGNLIFIGQKLLLP